MQGLMIAQMRPGPKGYGFSVVLVINRLSILAGLVILVINKVWFLYSSLDMGMFLSREATFSSLSKRKSTKALHKLCCVIIVVLWL